MPTLVEVPIEASMQSISQHQIDADSPARTHDDEQETFLNDSTRLLDETVLDNVTSLESRMNHDHDGAPGVNGSLLSVDNDETRLGETNMNDDTILGIARQLHTKQSANENSMPIFQYEKPVPAKRTVGPKEERYSTHFERYVTHLVADFRRDYPEKLKDYRSLSPQEKEKEQNRINALLARLGGGTTTTLQHCRAHVVDEVAPAPLAQESSGESSMTRLGPNHSDSLTDDSNLQNRNQSPLPANNSSASLLSRENEDAEMNSDETGHSSPLLSPESQVDELADRLSQSMALLSPAPETTKSPARNSQLYAPSGGHSQPPQMNDDSSASSVEIVRRTDSARSSPSSEMYESPTITTNRSKRQASASGKRGMDLSRMRLEDDSFASFEASAPRASEMIASPSQLLCSSLKSPESPLFNASQSPIGDAFSSAEKSQVEVQTSHLQVFEDNNDTLHSHDQTTNYRRKVRWNEESFLQEIPANVHLKEGVPFRMKPIRVGRPSREEVEDFGRRRRQIEMRSLPDPLSAYEGPVRKKVKAAYTWLKERDTITDDDENPNCGLLFSMDERQIIDVTMKLCIKHKSDHNLKDDTMNDQVLSGGTLIVARTKEDLEVWQSALRECTCFSVLNHATLSVDERKRTTTASRCAGHDIVVTTFDALKSKDIATPLDGKGHVVHGKVGFEGGWYSARSGGSQNSGRCEQLSVLHQIDWRRVVFADALGRKSFVAKGSTARAVAAVALTASSRFIFFPPAEDGKSNQVNALAKSDKKAFKSIAAVLHLSEDDAVGGRLSASMFDLKDVKTKKPIASRRREY